MIKKILYTLFFVCTVFLIYTDFLVSEDIDTQALETFGYNPAAGSCAPCGAPCIVNAEL